jgi:predicted transcriptional regulator
MKTATLPSLRVDPDLRDAAESVLREGESLSSFVESAVRTEIERRYFQHVFVERGLVARDRARRAGTYVDAADVVKGLRSKLAQAKKKSA